MSIVFTKFDSETGLPMSLAEHNFGDDEEIRFEIGGSSFRIVQRYSPYDMGTDPEQWTLYTATQGIVLHVDDGKGWWKDRESDIVGAATRWHREWTAKMTGYHVGTIEKGILGEASKIREETEEFLDAVEQKVSLMALVELSDLYGAVEAYLEKNHPTVTMVDLAEMSAVTKRAFRNGRR